MGCHSQCITGFVPISSYDRVNIHCSIIQRKLRQIRQISCPGDDQLRCIGCGGIVVEYLTLHGGTGIARCLVGCFHQCFHDQSVILCGSVDPCTDFFRYIEG